jgi:uncharacterized protein (TIGR00725 family)
VPPGPRPVPPGPRYVAVVGGSQPSAAHARAAEAVGEQLARAGAVVINGGGGGVMAAVSRGARRAGGLVIGILPGEERGEANEFVSVALATGLGELRNGLIVRAADVVLAVGGAYGTLSEVALALATGVPVVGLESWGIEGVEAAVSPEAAVARALELASPPAGGPRRRRRHP